MPGEEATRPENLEIPQEWQWVLQEHNGPIKSIIIDKKSGFLAVEFPSIAVDKGAFYGKAENADYFFNRNGELLDSKVCIREGNRLETAVTLIKDIKALYDFEEESKTPPLLQNEANLNVFLYLPLQSEEGDDTLSHSLGKFSFRYDLAEGDFAGLESISFGNIFAQGQNGKLIRSPNYQLKLFKHTTLGSTRIWRFETRGEYGPYACELMSDNQMIVRSGGKDIYKIGWEIEMELTDKEALIWNRARPVIIVTETHLPSGIQKIFQSPLIINMSKVLPLIHTRPAYEKRMVAKMEVLDVPWRNLPKLVGAHLEYQYPEDKKIHDDN